MKKAENVILFASAILLIAGLSGTALLKDTEFIDLKTLLRTGMLATVTGSMGVALILIKKHMDKSNKKQTSTMNNQLFNDANKMRDNRNKTICLSKKAHNI